MRRDDTYLLDMLIAARDAVTFVEGLTNEQFHKPVACISSPS